ncbi:hypothetical protein [Brasilonema sp. UFV-L1]|uniref:hypothetical protein n=1 Tax=Brasilonema sp. UFV-L1 TaxID=2234130 RepID=UPI00145F3341|nr:hypothetical protein [Brasilonema sp. UFV-L1]
MSELKLLMIPRFYILIKTINPAVDVKPFADIPIEAIARSPKNAHLFSRGTPSMAL